MIQIRDIYTSTNLHQALEQENIYPHIFQGLKIFLKEWGKIEVFVVVELCTFIIDKQWFDRNIVYFLLKIRKTSEGNWGVLNST